MSLLLVVEATVVVQIEVLVHILTVSESDVADIVVSIID
jgi:hypothetical protein